MSGLVASAAVEPPVAIRLTNVKKTYKLYSGPREQLLDALGIYRWLPARRRPAFQEFHALNDVNLVVRTGERIGIVGRNGAGKTTLLKLITGNFAPSSGSVTVNGGVQALMQLGLGFHPEFSGYQNIRSALNYSGLSGAESDRAVADVIDFVELGDFLHQPMKTYSLGMNARVQFAAATAIKPDILIVDEILGAGDAYFSAKSAVRMRQLAASGCTLLLVSHSVQQILQFCEKALWLEDGRIRMFAAAHEVVGAYEVDSQKRIAAAGRPAARQEQPRKTGGGTVFSLVDLPEYQAKSWIGDAISQKEKSTAYDQKSGETAVTLADGRKVFRWPSEHGVKVHRIYCSVNGSETNVFRTGESMEINLDLCVESTGQMQCRYYFSFFNLEALRLAWITSPIDEFGATAGAVRRIRVTLKPLLLGAGDFILSSSIFDGTDPIKINEAKRYDLLARCLQFRVIEADGRQSSVFHHPGSWSFAGALPPSTAVAEPARMAREP